MWQALIFTEALIYGLFFGAMSNMSWYMVKDVWTGNEEFGYISKVEKVVRNVMFLVLSQVVSLLFYLAWVLNVEYTRMPAIEMAEVIVFALACFAGARLLTLELEGHGLTDLVERVLFAKIRARRLAKGTN